MIFPLLALLVACETQDVNFDGSYVGYGLDCYDDEAAGRSYFTGSYSSDAFADFVFVTLVSPEEEHVEYGVKSGLESWHVEFDTPDGGPCTGYYDAGYYWSAHLINGTFEYTNCSLLVSTEAPCP